MSLKETFHKHFWRIIFALLLSVLIVLLIWLTINIRNLYHSGVLRPTRGFHRLYTRQQLSSPDQIQDWMTFSYLNYIFNLPLDYLASALSIHDSRYPNLTVGAYIKAKNLNTADFLKQVRGFVSQYPQNTGK